MDDTTSNPPIFCVGLTHQTTDLALREKIHIRPDALPGALAGLREACSIDEAVILSTCNRLEVYAVNGRESIVSWIAHLAPELSAQISDRIRTWSEKESVMHLFSVAAGLEAQVLGEPQILGQVKDAYEVARSVGMTGASLNILFQRAFAVGKRIRTETKIAETPVSVSSISVRLCEKIFGRLENHVALVVGAGEISCLAAEHLHERGAHVRIFSTRRKEPAEALAKSLSARCYPIESLPDHLADADIVISGSGAPHALITDKDIRQTQNRRGFRPLFLVDLAIPRDIDPSVTALENVFLYNLDDLDGIANEHRQEREREIPRCEDIVREETERFWEKLAAASGEDALHLFHSQITAVVEQELLRSGIKGEPLTALKKSIPNRILSEAFKRTRNSTSDPDNQTFFRTLKEFFGL